MKKVTGFTLVLTVVLLFGAGSDVYSAEARWPARMTARGYVPNEIIVKFNETAASLLEEQLPMKPRGRDLKLPKGLQELNAGYNIEQIRPLFKNFRREQQRLKALRKKNAASLRPKDKHIVRRLKRVPKGAKVPDLGGIYKVRFKLREGQSVEDILAAYQSHSLVEYAELNYIASINLTANDPLYPLQWPLNNIGQGYPVSGGYGVPPGERDRDVDAPDAWDKSTGSSDIVVAVIDTGVDYTHRDIDDNVWVNKIELEGRPGLDDDENGHVDDIYGYDFINGDSDPRDDHGHGTHCAGTVAAEGNNGLDIAGVCWESQIMALKFLGSDGKGLTDGAVEAFYYAVKNGADILSNSWGGGAYSETMQQAIEYAYSQGVLIVAAAGNDDSNTPVYPADYEHVISVAATDSRDVRAPFSNYGDWVDIAAPGVDILSLRAEGTSMGTLHDRFTTIASGTSMACPHVSGACALLLSLDQDVSVDRLYDALVATADPIAPGVCASGRLNLYGAMLRILGPQGSVWLDSDFYPCSGHVEVKLFDTDLSASGTELVTVSADGGDSETLVLTEASHALGIFVGTIPITAGVASVEDGRLQLSHGQMITATYYDADDGSGYPAIAADTAIGDCKEPVFLNVEIDAAGPQPRVILETDEPTTARVMYSRACGSPEYEVSTDAVLTTSHTISLPGVSPYTDYFFVVEANDFVDNQTFDDNNGRCYSFTTNGPGNVCVPADYATIQDAIDHSWDGGSVWIADGLYTGRGNRDIDFKGRSIAVRSLNGPNNCVIDCQGSQPEHHRGFQFNSGETLDSVLDGFTITNGYALAGGAIYCSGAAPTITNCIIRRNKAEQSGGGLYNCDGIISNCALSGNAAEDYGGAMEGCGGLITNCIITGNRAKQGGGLYNCDGVVSNCIIWANRPVDSLQYGSTVPLYSCVQTDTEGTGCISSDPCFVEAGHWDQNGTPDNPDDDFWVGGDYHLRTGSPCVNAGNYAYCMSVPCTDLDGGVRLAGTQIDMGCYETGSLADTDGDWLSDSVEPGYASESDRDGDGIPDGLELLRGTDPNAPDALGQVNIPADVGTVQEALLFSRPGEIIVLSEGTYYQNICIGGRDIILKSADPNDWRVVAATIINGNTDAVPETANGRVITFLGTESWRCRVQGLTITGGRVSNGGGGGIWGGGTSAQLINCIINGNTASDYGGGIEDFDGLITNCEITGNAAKTGGGLAICDGHISNCLISRNTAKLGGGLARCRAVLRHCIISENSAAHNGGGLLSHGGPITNCTISANTASQDGGGFQRFDGPLVNCNIIGNIAGSNGGALAHANAPITNCTISGNYAGKKGGAIYNLFQLGQSSPVVTSSILWENEAPSGPEIALDAFPLLPSPTLTVWYTDIQGGYTRAYINPDATLIWGTGNIDSDPCFVEPGYWADPDDANVHVEPTDPNATWVHGDYHLASDSPCINAGDPNYPGGPNDTDIDGQPRVFGGRVDIGADEFVPPPMAVPMKFTPQALNAGSRGKWVKAHLVLPEGIGVEDVDAAKPATLEPGGIESDRLDVCVNKQGLVEIEVSFDRAEFCHAVRDGGAVQVTVTGSLATGQYYYGTDMVKVINGNFGYLAVLAAHWLESNCRPPGWCGGLDLDKNAVVNFADFALFDSCSVELIKKK